MIEGVAETPYSNVTIKTDVAERGVQLPARAQGAVPGHRRREALPAQLPARRARRPSCSARCARSPRRSSRSAATAAWRPARASARAASSTATTPTCAARTATRRSSSTRSATATSGARPRGWSPSRATRSSSRSTSTSSAPPTTRCGARSPPPRATAPRPAPTWRWTRATARCCALGSYPSFDANVFAKPLSQRKYDQLNSEARGAPLFNRAIAATYPTGSTFKLVTAMAALEEGLITPSSTIVDTGVFKLGTAGVRQRQGRRLRPAAAAPGADGLLRRLLLRARRAGQRARARSSRTGRGGWASAAGPGSTSRASSRASSRTPSGATRATTSTSSAPRRPRSRPGTDAALYACGGIERPWSQGDNVNLAVGQGDLQATPLQLATAYSTVANGGRVVRPHLGQAVEDGAGPARAADPQARAAQGRVLRRQPAGDHGRPARRRLREGRHLGRRLPGLPVSGLRQDRHGRARARARISPGTRPTSRTRRARSWSSRRSRRAASARRLRHPRRA